MPKNLSLFSALLLLLASTPSALATTATAMVINDGRLTELSGLAASFAHPGFYWGHNDSGNRAELILIQPQRQTTTVVATTALGARDWEDIASFSDASGNYVLVADTGDNFALRPMVDLYLLAESGSASTPRLQQQRHYSVVFDGGPRDIEALAVDPRERMAYLLSKREIHPRLYRFSLDVLPGAPIIAQDLGRVTSLPSRQRHRPQPNGGISQHSPTGMDFASDGSGAAVSTLRESYYFPRKNGQSWLETLNGEPQPLTAPRLRQAEAIAFSTHGEEILLGSEGRPSKLVRFTDFMPSAPQAMAAGAANKGGPPLQ